jgi:hypothetical protein
MNQSPFAMVAFELKNNSYLKDEKDCLGKDLNKILNCVQNDRDIYDVERS